MPGMMDTVLNLGLNDRSVEGLAARTGNARFAFDSYRRFIQMFGDVVSEVEKAPLRGGASTRSSSAAASRPTSTSIADDLRELVATYKAIYLEHKGEPFPQDPRAQLDARHQRGLRVVGQPPRPRLPSPQPHPDDLGTAVNVQQMVFGNTGARSGTGVAFTPQQRDRREGRAVRRLPDQRPGRGRGGRASARRARWSSSRDELPEAFAQLIETMDAAGADLPQHAGRRVHHRGRHASTCCRRATASAAPRPWSASPSTWRTRASSPATRRCATSSTPTRSASCSCRSSTPRTPPSPLATGVNASPGAAVGAVVFTADEAERARQGRRTRDPGARRDHARRLARDDRGAGHPDRPRRQDQPRRDRRGRHGQARRLRRERDRASTTTAPDRRSPADRVPRGRPHHDRRHHRRRVHRRRAPGAAATPTTLTSREILEWADAARRLRVRDQRRHARGRRAAPASSAPRASASAAPSTCSTPRIACRSCRSMILSAGADDAGVGAGAAARPFQEQRLRGHLPRHGAACRSRSASSTRRCTSSCPACSTCRCRSSGTAYSARPTPRLDRRTRPSTRAARESTRCSARAAAASGSSGPTIYRMQVAGHHVRRMSR